VGESDCLSDKTLADVHGGRLPPDALARLQRHAAGCDSCRPRLAQVARGAPGEQAPFPGGKEIRPEDITQSILKPSAEQPSPPAGAPPPDGAWTPPIEFDEFRIERVLGRGGMGVVYLAQDTSLGRPVAVKFIASQHPAPLVRASFETEARVIARLQHPNVVTVFRVGQVEGRPYIVSEYIVGRSLAEQPLPLPWRRVLTLGLGLARGLAEAHRQGVLHRDLKPSNVLLTASGEVKLLDFGLAERFDPSGSPRLSASLLLAGTPRYMAPEVLRGGSPTPQSDIYSLGLTLYELCTGSLPHDADSVDRRTPPSLSGLVPGIDPDFAETIARCIVPAPSERFASADLLREALEHLEQTLASAPLAASNPYRGLAPFEAEHRAIFFGRDADIQGVLERLRRQPLVLVAGDSGVGKSSLCRAGVLPWVTAGGLDPERDFTTVTLWPGHRPLQALAAALAPLLGRKEAELFTALNAPTPWLGQALREAYQGRRGLLLFIDQLEELITQSDPAEASRFAAVLGELALPSTGVRVLLAVRGDFLTRVSALPGLGTEAERALYILRPMSAEGMREAIVGPARSRGVVFESEEFVQALVASTAHGAGSLPLLQFALAELWERRNTAQGRINGVALHEMGGVAGALSRHGDEVLERLSPAEQQAARRLLLRLVTAEGMRLQRSEEELFAPSDTASRTALQALVEGRIIYTHTGGAQARYELAHDSLMLSWGTLRNWIDDDIGHRAVRQRVEAASTEWARLGGAKEILWGQRQLDEARPLDPNTLGPQERAFLIASRRAVRLQRWGRYLAALLVALALAAVYGGFRLQTYLADRQFVAAELETARTWLSKGRELGKQARDGRDAALALFMGTSPASPTTSTSSQERWSAAEHRWLAALATLKQADAAYANANQSLEKALDRSRGNTEARQFRIKVTYERMLLAEHFYLRDSRDELLRRLERLVDSREGAEVRQLLSAHALLDLVTDPPGATVEISRYESDAQGAFRLEKILVLGPTPIAKTQLPAGSYLLRIMHPERSSVDLPLLLTRRTREQVRLTLPSDVPEGYVYIPPGCFLRGSADPEEVRGFLSSPPIHRDCIQEGYLIGKTEVTFGDWLEYLDSLPSGAQARRILEQASHSGAGAVKLEHQPDAGWIFSFYRLNKVVFTARVGEEFRYPGRSRNKTANWLRFPLSGVSEKDLEGYFYWLDTTGRLPGARLCNEREWERAARGADGRAYPHGDRLLPDDANIDVTYDRQDLAFGPDMVGTHPASMSPFGLHDMAGNAWELTRPATQELGDIILRGGAWYFRNAVARTANREAGYSTLRDVTTGVRVCASFSAR
jgi:formylglycine-generating enzyme required for sulfatase activity/predicted Ser/Thr protein kinase